MVRTIVIGKLRYSEDDDDDDYLYIQTDDGGLWTLDIPKLMAAAVDRMLNMRVMVEGGWIGISTIIVSAIVQAE